MNDNNNEWWWWMTTNIEQEKRWIMLLGMNALEVKAMMTKDGWQLVLYILVVDGIKQVYDMQIRRMWLWNKEWWDQLWKCLEISTCVFHYHIIVDWLNRSSHHCYFQSLSFPLSSFFSHVYFLTDMFRVILCGILLAYLNSPSTRFFRI